MSCFQKLYRPLFFGGLLKYFWDIQDLFPFLGFMNDSDAFFYRKKLAVCPFNFSKVGGIKMHAYQPLNIEKFLETRIFCLIRESDMPMIII